MILKVVKKIACVGHTGSPAKWVDPPTVVLMLEVPKTERTFVTTCYFGCALLDTGEVVQEANFFLEEVEFL